MPYQDLEVINNEAIHQFQLTVEDYTAFIDYIHKNDKYYLVHTGVPTELEGKGVASALVEKTLAHLEGHNAKIVPMCTYVQMFLKRHPEWNRMVA